MEGLIPTKNEAYKYEFSTVKHAIRVEYYLSRAKPYFKQLGITFSDPERPHDLVGPGNRLEWEAIKGFALQYRESGVDFDTYVKPSLEFHRQQYHHVKGNGSEFPPDASEADKYLAMLDAVCALREPREYYGGAHSWGDVIKECQKLSDSKAPYMLKVIELMLSIGEPNLESITSLSNIPNIGLDQRTYDLIVERARYAADLLESKYPESSN